MKKCTLCNSGDIEDEYQACDPNLPAFKDLRTKYITKYYYVCPSMAIIIELMNVEGKRKQFTLMLFLKYMVKLQLNYKRRK